MCYDAPPILSAIKIKGFTVILAVRHRQITIRFIASLFLFLSSCVFANHNEQAVGDTYAFEQCRLLQAKPFDPTSEKKKAIIIGDSQGCDFLNGVHENEYLKHYQIQFRFIPYACQRIPQDNVADYIPAKHRPFCLQTERVDTLKKAKAEIQQADLVIFALRWKLKVAEKLPQLFHYLAINTQQTTVIVGSKFFGKITLARYMDLPDDQLKALKNNVGTASSDINTILKQQVKQLKKLDKRVIFVDSHQLMCGNETQCPVFTHDLKLISYDGRHLTKDGARYFGKLLFQQSMLRKM